MNGVWDERPDLVISGINHGSNLGDDVLYSGTVAAAMEGRNLGMTAIAMSLCGERYFATAAKVAASLIGAADQLSLPPRTLLNVNVPDVPWEEIKGVRVTRLRLPRTSRETCSRKRSAWSYALLDSTSCG